MTIKKNTFEGGAAGATLAAGQAGSGDPLDSVAPTNGATLTYDNAHAMHGTKSALVTPTSTGQARFDYRFTSSNVAVKAYFYLTSLPAADTFLMHILTSAFGRAASFHINTAGKLRLADSTGTTGVWTAASTFPLNQWVRLEIYGAAGASTTTGTLKGAAYLGDSTTPIEAAYSSSAANMGTVPFGGVAGGKLNGSSTYATTYWVDDFTSNDAASDFIGVATNTAPTVTAGAPATASPSSPFSLPFTATDAEGDALTYSAVADPGNPAALGTLTVTATAVTGTSPAAAGKYLVNVTANDGQASTTRPLTLYVTSTSTTPTAVKSNAGAWTSTGGTIPAALADADPATYAESLDNPSGSVLGVTGTPYAASATARVSYQVSQSAASPARSVVVGLYQNGTLIASKTETLTTTVTSGFFDLTAPQLAAWTDRTEPEIRFTAS